MMTMMGRTLCYANSVCCAGSLWKKQHLLHPNREDWESQLQMLWKVAVAADSFALNELESRPTTASKGPE